MHPQLFNHFFGREENDPGTTELLRSVAAKYPYFGPAHFYLLKNTKNTDPGFEITAAKTSLFFTDPFFLKVQLQKEEPVQQKTAAAVVETAIPQTTSTDSPIPDATQKPEEMLFEPLHASDYFASQGIKLSEEALSEDKLGKQLKSFTAWLKTMKKVHPDKMPETTPTDAVVQHLAEKSNLEEDVLTEAMAEACVLQGKNRKAAEIWTKLSLLNPSKTAYFAAKIDSLKL
ncbi:MAG: hypothetical protein WKF88_12350 [Ferruginibacter sp.]